MGGRPPPWAACPLTPTWEPFCGLVGCGQGRVDGVPWSLWSGTRVAGVSSVTCETRDTWTRHFAAGLAHVSAHPRAWGGATPDNVLVHNAGHAVLFLKAGLALWTARWTRGWKSSSAGTYRGTSISASGWSDFPLWCQRLLESYRMDCLVLLLVSVTECPVLAVFFLLVVCACPTPGAWIAPLVAPPPFAHNGADSRCIARVVYCTAPGIPVRHRPPPPPCHPHPAFSPPRTAA